MILGKLKEATKEQHKNLEGTVNVMDEMFSMDNYKNLLAKFYRFYSGIEPELAKLNWSEVKHNFDDRLKLPKIEKDLANLGILDQVKKELSPWDSLPSLDSHAKAFGALYVIEGATLGGQVIKRHLEQHLKITPENGGKFFSGYGEMTGKMWKEFCMTTTIFAEKLGDDDPIVQSARDTFDSFRECFEASAELKEEAASAS